MYLNWIGTMNDQFQFNEKSIIQISPIIFCIGIFLIIFSLLRYYSWDRFDLKFLGGIGLILCLFGIDLYIKTKRVRIGFIGFLISFLALLVFYFIVKFETDILVFLYALGVSIILSDILMNDVLSRFYSDLTLQYTSLKETLDSRQHSEKPVSNENVENLIEISMDVWRMEKRINTFRDSFDENKLKLFENSIERLKRALNKSNIEIIDFTNQKYNEGQNVDILARETDPSITYAYIRETIEPTILHNQKIVKRGKIIVVEKE